jgi:hypothetical protein
MMDFPIENPVFRFLYWLLNTPGLGALAVAMLSGGLLTTFGLSLRWIVRGSQAAERDIFTFPTSGFHTHAED